MKVLLTGATGQLGRSLQSSVPHDVELIAPDRSACDLSDPDSLAALVANHRPQWVINAAAYTQVDRAEQEREVAFRINAEAPGLLARAARDAGARLIHVSTDFVFDGTQSTAYEPEAACHPLNVYGESKLAGEQAVREALPDAVIVRTAWVYSRHGTNFATTMLRLMGSRDEISVVDDQIGTPTWAASLARAIWAAASAADCSGIFHWTDAGVASWYDFAVAIEEEARARGLLTQPVVVKAISSAEYRSRVPATVVRPAFSVLATRSTIAQIGITPSHWRHNLRHMLDELVR